MEQIPTSYINNVLATQQLPELELVEIEKLDPNWRKSHAILAAFWLSIPIIGVIVGSFFIDDIPHWGILPAILTPLITLLIWLVAYPYLAYKKKSYMLREHDITYTTGLIWQKEVTITYNRVQHLEVSQGPIQKRFGLSSLQLFTAGGQKSDMEISGLKPETAQKIKAWVARKAELEK
jgi:membrane protein YdbS with pleckstrin-like domain